MSYGLAHFIVWQAWFREHRRDEAKWKDLTNLQNFKRILGAKKTAEGRKACAGLFLRLRAPKSIVRKCDSEAG
jgi:hypothetical protein